MHTTSFIKIVIFTGSLCLSLRVNSQEVAENTKVTDAFQENFFEALKQKGIENYENAVVSLQKCQQLRPQSAVVYFEMGKNYRLLEKYPLAVQNLQKATAMAPQKEEVWAELYKTQVDAGNYGEAVNVLSKLVTFDPLYKQDLANMYMLNEEYEKALNLLKQLNSEYGKNSYRQALEQQIYARTNNTQGQINTLQEHIKQNPEDENNYLNLIYLYSSQGKDAKAFETANLLLKEQPGSTLVHLALYKFYLDKDKAEAAINSMKIVFNSEEIDIKSKFKVLNDFLNFVNKNPQWEQELQQVSQQLAQKEQEPLLYEKLGDYYLEKGNKKDALTYFELGVAANSTNFELLKNTVLLEIEVNKIEAGIKNTSKGLEIFPAQPVFYLLKGVLLNKQQAFKEAGEILTFGLDYLIDDRQMKADFYKQLSISYTGLGEHQKAANFKDKAQQLLKE